MARIHFAALTGKGLSIGNGRLFACSFNWSMIKYLTNERTGRFSQWNGEVIPLTMTDGTERVIGHNSLVDFATEQIRKDITEDILPPGEKINFNYLCERYGISPTPIKQALNRLMMEGLVEGIPRRGYRVCCTNWKELEELFELRLMMELHFADKATETVAASTIIQSKFEKNIQDNLFLVQNFTTAKEYFQTYEMDQQFHELYIRAGGNQAAVRTYKSLNTHTYAAYLFHKQPKEKTVDGIVEHQAIFSAMKSGDVDEVRQRVTYHNKNARTKIEIALKIRSWD